MNNARIGWKAFAMLTVVMLFWAGNSIVGRSFRDDIPPFTLAFVRWIGALCILTPFTAHQVRHDAAIIARHWRIVLLLGLTGVAAFNALLYTGLHYTTASNGMLLQAAIPALVLLFDRLIHKVQPGRWQMIGVALSTIGVVIIIFRADPSALLGLSFGYGDMLVLSGVVCWSIYTTMLRLRPHIHQMSFLTVTFAIGALAMLPLAATEWAQIKAIPLRLDIVGAFAYVAIFPSVLAYWLYNAAVAEIGPGRAGQTISLLPLFGALLATLVLKEPLHGYHLAGMVLILSGILVTILMQRNVTSASN